MISSHEFYKRIRQNIETAGRMVLAVSDNPPFCYSIGNAERGLPEIYVAGIADSSMQWIINEVSERMVAGDKFLDGAMISLGGAFPVKAVTMSDEGRLERLIQAGQYYGHDDYCAIQLIVPDTRGRFPDDPNCDEPYRSIIVYRRRLN